MLPTLSWIEKWLGNLAYSYPDDSICLSQLTRDDATFLKSKRTWIVPNGIPDEAADFHVQVLPDRDNETA